MLERTSLWQCNNRLGRGEQQKEGGKLGDHCIYQGKDDSDSNQGGSKGSAEKQSVSGH